jgi:hypothetical protein
MAVFDCCSFLNENDLYEIRLNQHWDFVDKFIVIEVGETHTGLKKSLNFDHERFKPYASKLVYVTFDNFVEEIAKYPELIDDVARAAGAGERQNSDDWIRCYFQDNYIFKILTDLGATDSDIVYISCLDEILRKEAFYQGLERFNTSELFNGLRPVFYFHLYLYAYKLNLLHRDCNNHHAGVMTEFGNFKKILPASIRHLGISTHPHIQDGGWHFTFLDNTDGEMVLQKQRSWAHSRDEYPGQKLKFDHTTKEEAVERFFHDYAVTLVDIKEGTHPPYIVNNLDKFQNFIYRGKL